MKLVVMESDVAVQEKLKSALNETKELELVGMTDDGVTGCEMVDETDADIVLISQTLKCIDGYEAFLTVRQRHPNAVIYASGYNTSDQRIASLTEMGIRQYFIRPFHPEKVIERIAERTSDPSAPSGRTENINLDEKISNIFLTIGIPPNIRGFKYLKEGIKLVVNTPDLIDRVTKELYPKVAERCNTTDSKVERSIRHAIEVAWNRCSDESIRSVFGSNCYLGKYKPTNSEFIALIAEKIIIDCFK